MRLENSLFHTPSTQTARLGIGLGNCRERLANFLRSMKRADRIAKPGISHTPPVTSSAGTKIEEARTGGSKPFLKARPPCPAFVPFEMRV
jgi:hypothetical protein